MPKVIVVSGGSDGLGKEIARVLSRSNQVVILAHNLEKLQSVAKELNCDYAEADVSKYDQVEKAITQVISKYDRLDSLANSVGIWTQGKITENSPEEIQELLSVNTQGTIFLCKAVIPQMEKQGRGEIINIISQDGLYAKKDRSLYHASKWAITGFTKCLQQDLSEKNIRVTGIYPGLMKTGLFEKKGVKRDLTHSLELSEVARLVEFVINLSPDTHIPEIGIKHLLNTDSNMDDPGTGLDLNLDPDLITTQGGPQSLDPASTPPAPTEPTPGVIDITPRATPVSPTSTDQIPTPPITPAPPAVTPIPESSPAELQPSVTTEATLPPLPSASEPASTPLEEPSPSSPPANPLPPLPSVPEVSPMPSEPSSTIVPQTETPTEPPVAEAQPASQGTPVTPTPLGNIPVQPPATETPKNDSSFAVDSSSPLFENPDTVKLAK